MKTTTNAVTPTLLATRTTADGYTVEAWSDGRLAFRNYCVGGPRLTGRAMWAALDEVCLYLASEIETLVRAAKRAFDRKDGSVALMRLFANGKEPRRLGKLTGRDAARHHAIAAAGGLGSHMRDCRRLHGCPVCH